MPIQVRKREIEQFMASRSIQSRLRRYSIWMLSTLMITGFLFFNLREAENKLARMQALGYAVASLSERNRSPQQAQILAIASLPAVAEYLRPSHRPCMALPTIRQCTAS